MPAGPKPYLTVLFLIAPLADDIEHLLAVESPTIETFDKLPYCYANVETPEELIPSVEKEFGVEMSQRRNVVRASYLDSSARKVWILDGLATQVQRKQNLYPIRIDTIISYALLKKPVLNDVSMRALRIWADFSLAQPFTPHPRAQALSDALEVYYS